MLSRLWPTSLFGGRFTKVFGCLLFVVLGSALVFGGFEAAAYEQTIADREVTTTGTVIDTNVYQLPDGNWTYTFDYEYDFDQEAAILDQGLEELYPYEMASRQTYASTESGGKHDTQRSARRSMENKFESNGRVLVYVDPFYPGEGSLSDATSAMPRILQYAGSLVLALGLLGLARMARRVSA